MNIFLDLDETLINTQYCRDSDKEYKENTMGKYNAEEYEVFDFDMHGYTYMPFLRPSAAAIISICESFVGAGNVKMATAATRDYALEIVNHYKFPIKEENIYTREDIYHGDRVSEEWEGDNNVLIDNENFFYHINGSRNKSIWLGLTSDKLYEIADFHYTTRNDSDLVDLKELMAFLEKNS